MNVIYWVIIDAEFKEPLQGYGELPDSLGFLQTFGCTESCEQEMEDRINSFLSEWSQQVKSITFDTSVIAREDVEKEVLMDDEINGFLVSSPYDVGIWYKSGKIFYGDDEDDEEGWLVEFVPGRLN